LSYYHLEGLLLTQSGHSIPIPNMEYAMRSSWKEVFEVVGVAAIVLSLAFVGFQLRQDQSVALTQALSELDGDAIELSQAIHQNRVVWRAGLDGKELSQDDAITFLFLAKAVEQIHRSRYTRAIQLRIGEPAFSTEGYAFQLYLYSGLRTAAMHFENLSDYEDDAFGRQRRTGPHQRFMDDVIEALAELERTNPPKPEKDYVPL
jgi:hypothetical protein